MSGPGAAFRWRRKRVGLQPKTVHPVVGLQQQVNRLFNDFFSGSQILSDWVADPLQQLGEQLTGFVPNVRMVCTDADVIVAFELPGVDENDLELSLTRESLTIRGYRRLPDLVTPHGAAVSIAELEEGQFERTVALEVAVNEDGADATFERGLLIVKIPRRPAAGESAKIVPIRSQCGRE